jgi:hypothetical protein
MKKLDAEIRESGLERRELRVDISERQWQALAEAFPELGLILSEQYSRDAFFANMEHYSGVNFNEAEFWKYRTLSPTGQEFVRRVMPSEFVSMPGVALNDNLSEIDALAEELLK